MVKRIRPMFGCCVRFTDEKSFFSSLEPVPSQPPGLGHMASLPGGCLVKKSTEALPAVVPGKFKHVAVSECVTDRVLREYKHHSTGQTMSAK